MVQHHELDNDKRHLSYAAVNLLILDIKGAKTTYNVKFMAKIAKIKVNGQVPQRGMTKHLLQKPNLFLSTK